MPAILLLAGAAVSAADGRAAGQPPQVSETIVVSGPNVASGTIAFETRHVVWDDVVRSAHADAVEIIDSLPSTHIPTNSRGETLVYLRNAAERQVAIFYDGAAINVPWDNRLDLSLVPVGLVAAAQSASGPLAPHYGVNALGAVNLSPHGTRKGTDLAFSLGEAGAREARARLALAVGDMDEVVLGGSYAIQDGQPLSRHALLPYSQADSPLRTNTDREMAGGFALGRAHLGGHQLSVTVFHIAAEKGIAPEGDRPSGARFWRYPEVRHSLAMISLVSPIGEHAELRSVLWHQWFGQTIESYSDASYSRIDAQEVDRDETFGIRELLSHEAGNIKLVGSFNFLDSRHRQRDVAYDAGEQPDPLPPFLHYRQRNWSVAGEGELRIGDHLVAEIGLGYDWVEYVETGDKPPSVGSGGWSGRAGVIWSGPSDVRLRAAIGRKVRTPTMRELFGNALNRFLINPELKPERIITAEVGIEWQPHWGAVFAIPFYQHVDGTIDQRAVGRLRQRINLVGSRVAGFEVGGQYLLTPEWQLSGSLTWATARRRGTQPGQPDRLAEKPDLVANLRVAFAPQGPFAVDLEVASTAQAYSADATGQLVALPDSTTFNLHARYRLSRSSNASELFLDVQNVGDTLVEPQLGLPDPGRWVRGGVRISW